ncbi:hypothetical protein BAE44_0000100, partial [Dichanthelium oligosanthes]
LTTTDIKGIRLLSFCKHHIASFII